MHAAGSCAEARREGASAGQLEAAVGLIALDALRIACRAGHNRAALTQLGLLPALTRLMKVSLEARPPAALSILLHLPYIPDHC